MLKHLSRGLLSLSLLLAAAWLCAAAHRLDVSHSTILSKEDGGTLTVTQINSTSALMAWTAFGNGQYQITVRNLATSTILTNFSTSNTSASIGGLVVGNTYRYEVSSAGESLILELIVNG